MSLNGAGVVWLYGDVRTSPGLLGFLYSARKEPGGERLNAIYSWDEEIIDPMPLIQQCERLKMNNNCFRNGRHGVYLSFDTEVFPAPSSCDGFGS